jgi:hypothetical protein
MSVSIEDFLELYDAALAVTDKIQMHIDLREAAAHLRQKYDNQIPDPLSEDV